VPDSPADLTPVAPDNTRTLPVLPLPGGVVLPSMVVTIALESPEAQAAAGAALGDSGAGEVLLVPRIGDRYAHVGALARVESDGTLPGGTQALVVRATGRAVVGVGVVGTGAGLWVTGKDKQGQPRSTYLYHVVDNEETMREYGHQCVVWQTAINPVVALELLATGAWQGTGVLGPEAFDAVPFLDLLTAYGSPWGVRELTP